MSNPYFDKSDYKLVYKPSKSDKRREVFKKQRKSWGFDETQLWSLDDTTLKFLIPRLILVKDTPGKSQELNDKIGEMIECFQYVLDHLYTFNNETLEEFKTKSARGFYLLGESMGALWF